MTAASSSLPELAAAGAAAAIAIEVPEDRRSISYAELAVSVGLLAGGLQAAGVRRGDRVAMVLPNGPEFMQVLLAITALGAAAAPLNPGYTSDEFRFYLQDLDPRLLLLPRGEVGAARAARGDDLELVEVASQNGAIELGLERRSIPATGTSETAGADDIALLLHTSGTTSRPKQVPLTHHNLLSCAAAIATHYALSDRDVSYCVMPLFHVHGLVASTLATLSRGGTVVAPRRVYRQRLVSDLRRAGVTWFSAGPTLHHMFLERAGEEALELPNLRFLRSCSSALPQALQRRVEARYGVPLLEAYGMTEASHQIASNPLPPAPRAVGAVGIATGTRIRIVGRAGEEPVEGEAGEVQIRGPGVTSGYLNNPTANQESFVDGWFRTGDLGSLRAGYLTLHGRLKEMIIRGGENVSPLEVEDALMAHPAVADAACFGVRDDKYGEEVAAAVRLHAECDETQLIRHCRERLSSFKVPKTVHILDAIPRTPTGKLQRRRIASMFTDQPR